MKTRKRIEELKKLAKEGKLTKFDVKYVKYHAAADVALQHGIGIDYSLKTYVNPVFKELEDMCEE